jgi:hypothetical protein
MAFLGTTYRNKVLDMVLNQTNITAPTLIACSLHTAAVGTTGASEASGSSYARIDVTANFPAASAGSCANNVAINFAAFSGALTFTDAGLYDATSAGNWIGGGVLSASKTVANGDTASFSTSNFTVTCT